MSDIVRSPRYLTLLGILLENLTSLLLLFLFILTSSDLIQRESPVAVVKQMVRSSSRIRVTLVTKT